ncbi:histidine kinase [Oxalobacteraceae sp. CFBP 8755]|nr:histidine kinase [Oxalobacteraceae sp. CFBP 8753]MBD8632433.1 histidine kinase [Oxalobacteraceae sp. CFBP 8755]
MQARSTTQHHLAGTLSWLYRAFDGVATWVTQLSWWKFLLFAGLTLTAAGILQEELFNGPAEEEIARAERESGRRSDASILIDESGIRFNPRTRTRTAEPPPATTPETPEVPAVPDTPDAPPGPPVTVTAPSSSTGAVNISPGSDSVHIELPPQIGEELSNAIEAAVEDAAEQKVSRYHKQASTWFMNFVVLLLLALFGTKALVGGKKRADAEAQVANAAAEREAMQRQLMETKMQMMQAQVEPHFLFNTLASVEHLIRVDPPRASAMQRSLIQYLRAVLPQMRDNAVVTGLGREVDMVNAYLDLLKMRMEERLTVNLRVPDGLRSAAFPPMMLQSMVENAIKHGLECKPEGGTLNIVAEVVDSRLRVTVADDGVGFGVMPSDGTGLGLQTIRERLKLLHGEAGWLHIGANSPTGVIATIEVPYQLSK